MADTHKSESGVLQKHRWCTAIYKTLILESYHLHEAPDRSSRPHELLTAQGDIHEVCYKQVQDIPRSRC